MHGTIFSRRLLDKVSTGIHQMFVFTHGLHQQEDDCCQGEIHSTTIVVVVWKHSNYQNRSQVVWRLDKLTIFYDFVNNQYFAYICNLLIATIPQPYLWTQIELWAMGQSIFPTLSSRLSSQLKFSHTLHLSIFEKHPFI